MSDDLESDMRDNALEQRLHRYMSARLRDFYGPLNVVTAGLVERAMSEVALQVIRADRAALAAGTRSAETNEDLAPSEGCQSGDAKQRNAQSNPPSGGSSHA